MGGAFLALYTVQGTPILAGSGNCRRAIINAKFKSDPGFSTSSNSSTIRATQQVDENVALSAVCESSEPLFRRTPNTGKWPEHALRYLGAPGVAERRGFQVGGILLADRELSSAPLHITVVGRKSDPTARLLFLAALKQPATYKRIEWLDETEGPLRNSDVEYPRIDQAAAFFAQTEAVRRPSSRQKGSSAR